MLLVNGALCYRFGGRTLFVTIPIVGIVYGFLDAAWIDAEMAKPDWDGQPDQDAVYFIGVILRSLFAAAMLLGSFVTAIWLSNAIHAGNRKPNDRF
jgi:hypothetical protein